MLGNVQGAPYPGEFVLMAIKSVKREREKTKILQGYAWSNREQCVSVSYELDTLRYGDEAVKSRQR